MAVAGILRTLLPVSTAHRMHLSLRRRARLRRGAARTEWWRALWLRQRN